QIDSGVPGTGNGAIGFHLLPNPGLTRQASIRVFAVANQATLAVFTTTEAGAPVFAASGRVLDRAGAGVPDVVLKFMRLSGPTGGQATATTDSQGRWSNALLAQGAVYQVTPLKKGYSFIPANHVISAPSTTVDFTGYPSFSVSGTVLTSTSTAI